MATYFVERDGKSYTVECNDEVENAWWRLVEVVDLALLSKEDLFYPHQIQFPQHGLEAIFTQHDDYDTYVVFENKQLSFAF